MNIMVSQKVFHLPRHLVADGEQDIGSRETSAVNLGEKVLHGIRVADPHPPGDGGGRVPFCEKFDDFVVNGHTRLELAKRNEFVLVRL